MKAQERICADLKNDVLRELKKQPNGKAIVSGVEFHTTIKRSAKYPKDVKEILDNLKNQIDEQKKRAEDAGTVKYSSTDAFDASIPKSSEKEILIGESDYKKHFGVS
jgi:uncharacterized protein YukE